MLNTVEETLDVIEAYRKGKIIEFKLPGEMWQEFTPQTYSSSELSMLINFNIEWRIQPTNDLERFKKMTMIATHNGAFHADEIVACAILKEFQPEAIIVRTRNLTEIALADIVVDVGGQYNPQHNQFDHHQRGFNEFRPNGIKYSSAGLVWRHFWMNYLEYVANDTPEEVYEDIDRTFIQGIDAIDNGQELHRGLTFQGASPFTFSNLIASFNPSWIDDNSSEAFNEVFEHTVALVQELFRNLVRNSFAKYIASNEVKRKLTNAGNILVLDEFMPWQDTVSGTQVQFVVFPDINKGWRVQGVPVSPGSFECKIFLKEEWRGLSIKELQAVSGIPDITFVHRNGFIGGADTKESVIRMAMESMN